MKQRLARITALGIFLVAATAAADEAKREPRADAQRRDVASRPHPGGLIETSWLIDRPVRGADGTRIGKIRHVWFDPTDGRIKEVVVEVDRGLLAPDTHKLIPWRDVNVRWDNQQLVVVMDEAAVRGAPRYEARPDGERGTPAASPPSAPATPSRSR